MRERDDRWKELCRQVAVEQDPMKLSNLVRQITELLDSKNTEPPRQKAQSGD